MDNFRKSDVTIRDIEVVSANLVGKNITIIKLLTSEPELYGLGCSTFAYRNQSVEVYIKEYILPLIKGRNVKDIEDLWHIMNTNGYWRNGPITNNAISGIDIALWDIKGKMANMPVYNLLGGKSRQAVPVYRHADGDSLSEVLENIYMFKDDGYNHFRVQFGVYGGKPENLNIPNNSFSGEYFCVNQYMNKTLELFEGIRADLGFDIQLMHDSHERLTPIQAIDFAKQLEKYRLFFLEDILSPEQGEWFKVLRKQVSTPIAGGELFNNPKEWDFLITNKLIDFVRIHISQIGGLTPARKVAIFAEQFGIRTAWHGPSDASPIAHAVNAHLGIVSHNTGIQEWTKPLDNPILIEAFPGCPQPKSGYLYVNDKPGLGIDVNMEILKKNPPTHNVPLWTQTRHIDGTMCTP